MLDKDTQRKIESCKALQGMTVEDFINEEGRAGTRWYRVVDILKLKAADAARAELK